MSVTLRNLSGRLLPTILLLCTTGCGPGTGQDAPATPPLEAYRHELLRTAFDTASAIPVQPHIDSRSKAQKRVFDTCLALGQADLAAQYAPLIKDWRRGMAHADLACHHAQSGEKRLAQENLGVAEQIVAAVQDWPRDRIAARIAQAEVLLGRRPQEVERRLEGVDETEVAKVAVTQADVSTEAEYPRQIEAMNKLLGSNHFDLRKQGLLVGVELYDNFYLQTEHRNEIESTMREALKDFYPVFRIELLLSLAEAAIRHGDVAEARALLEEANGQVESANLQLRYGIPLMARMARVATKAGVQGLALSMASGAQEIYEQRELEITDIDRAGTLAPLAEAFQAMGDAAAAREIYGRALEAAVVNPNSRPRAEDLSALCVSMAVGGTEPDAGLWSRIREVNLGLGDPW